MRLTTSIKHVVLVIGCLVAASATAREHPARALLRTQITYVVESLRMGEIEFAEAHLAVLQAEFPDETRITTYYAGVLAFQKEAWKAAVKEFSQLPPRKDHDDSDVLVYLFYSHLNLGNLDRADLAIRELEKEYGKTRDAADARIALAQLLFHKGDLGPARAYEMVAGLAKTFPKHPQHTWIMFADAEHAWNAIQQKLKARGKKDVALSKALDADIRTCIKRYQDLRRLYPKSDEATASDFRIAALRQVLGE